MSKLNEFEIIFRKKDATWYYNLYGHNMYELMLKLIRSPDQALA